MEPARIVAGTAHVLEAIAVPVDLAVPLPDYSFGFVIRGLCNALHPSFEIIEVSLDLHAAVLVAFSEAEAKRLRRLGTIIESTSGRTKDRTRDNDKNRSNPHMLPHPDPALVFQFRASKAKRFRPQHVD